MLTHEDDEDRFVCHECIGDSYLKREVHRTEPAQTCMICGKRRRAIAFGHLCDRIHEVITEEFDRTASEPENWVALSRTRFPWTQNWLNRSVQGGPEHDR